MPCEQCDREATRLGRWCEKHYYRYRRHGDPTVVKPRTADLTGQRFGTLVVQGRDTSRAGPSSYWTCLCDCGAVRSVRRWSLTSAPIPTRTCGGSGHRRTDNVKYTAAHDRVRKDRGSATTYVCACGAPAQHWAYDHTDPDERVQEHKGSMLPYSLDVNRYTPMCVPCHKRADLQRKR